jgi:nucleotide-binding universal stress UspA family protein
VTKTLIVPLDGSPTAETALGPAVCLARPLGARLQLLHSTVGAHDGRHRAYLADVADGRLTDKSGRAPLEVPEGIETLSRTFVWPAQAITEALESEPDAALCMTTHGRGAIGRYTLGSVADQVVGDARDPIVLVGPAATLTQLTGRRIVLCWHGIDIEPDLYATTRDWARALGLGVTVLHVRGHHSDDGDATFAEWQQARRAVRERLCADGVDAGAVIVDGHNVADAIVTHASNTPTALIAMGTRRHDPGRQGPLDSTVLRVARHAPRPLLVQSPPLERSGS